MRMAIVGEMSGKLRLLFNVYEILEVLKMIAISYPYNFSSFPVLQVEWLGVTVRKSFQVIEAPSSILYKLNFFKLMERVRKECHTEARTSDSWDVGNSC